MREMFKGLDVKIYVPRAQAIDFGCSDDCVDSFSAALNVLFTPERNSTTLVDLVRPVMMRSSMGRPGTASLESLGAQISSNAFSLWLAGIEIDYSGQVNSICPLQYKMSGRHGACRARESVG